jgi:outer membrane protein OmpA-like peptidoglycan-associated protein
MRKLPVMAMLLLPVLMLSAQCPEGLVTGDRNLIRNGDFEEDEAHFTTEYRRDSVADAGRYLVVRDANVFCRCFTGTGDGKFLAVDGASGPNKIVWQQEVDVKENTTYFFSAWVSNLYTIKPAVLQFSINGRLLGQPFRCSPQRNVWEQFFVNWHSGRNTRIAITVVSQNPDSNGNDFGLDRVRFYECTASSLEAALEKAGAEEAIPLRNVLFETDKWEILPASYPELDLLVKYLRDHPSVMMEIAGHTDHVGDEKHNLLLSQRRAEAVVNHLIEKGINAKRLVANGYGMKHPVDSNETLEGRQKNRRVAFRITKR